MPLRNNIVIVVVFFIFCVKNSNEPVATDCAPTYGSESRWVRDFLSMGSATGGLPHAHWSVRALSAMVPNGAAREKQSVLLNRLRCMQR